MEEERIEEQGLSLSDLVFLVKKDLLLIILVTILCTLLGIFYGVFVQKDKFESTAICSVEVDPASTNLAQSTSYSLSVSLVKTIQEYILLEPVIEKALESEELKDYVEQKIINKDTVSKYITVTSKETNSMVLYINAETTDKVLSKKLANALMVSVKDYLDNTLNEGKTEPFSYEPDVEKNDGSMIKIDNHKYTILRDKIKMEAFAEEGRKSNSPTMIILVSFLVGLVISFVIILIKYLTNDTCTSKEDFEKRYGINILASIQAAEIGGNN